ncbi:Protein OS-9 [Phaffia rhodozyma]|uniref:Protein OS-9 homolog n=1 Tax=Phaffia rhodozyma TaxID=264483 RepID=A0A0F7SPX8_PHARH|nr:Protein OS-9 [Phaffia rhodozyma]
MLPHPLSPLTVLLLSTALTSRLASGSLTPIDPFAHPKYAIQFLNDLPLEKQVAESWIERGRAPGGWRGFLNENDPVGRDSTVPALIQDKKQEDEGGELEIRRSNQEGGTKDEEKIMEDEDGSHTLQSVMLWPGPRSYVCLIPPPSPEPKEREKPLVTPGMNPELPAQLLSHLEGTCLYHRQGWFTYSYCHGSEVRQFREAARAWPPLSEGWVPKEDPQYDAYVLGTAKHDLQIESNNPGFSLGMGVGARYLTARWGGGTVCDRTKVDREIEIQFHCSMTGTDGISLIKEVSTCSYILVIDTPRLCNVPGFSSAHLSEPPTNITCREIVPDGSIPNAEIEGMTKPSSDKTPLPSWAMIGPPPVPKGNRPPTGQQKTRDSSQPQLRPKARSKSTSPPKSKPESKPNPVSGAGAMKPDPEANQDTPPYSSAETNSEEGPESETKSPPQVYILMEAEVADGEENGGADDENGHGGEIARLLKALKNGQADGRYVGLLSDPVRTDGDSVSEEEQQEGEGEVNQEEEEEVWQIVVLKDENGDDLILEVPVEGNDDDSSGWARDEL